MYSTTSKPQESCTCKDLHPKCFITANFDKFHRKALRGVVRFENMFLLFSAMLLLSFLRID